MAFLGSMNIVGSGLTAQQLRLDVISENITNLNTTRTEEGDGPYRRKIVVFEAESGRNDFRMAMASAMGASNRGSERAGGVSGNAQHHPCQGDNRRHGRHPGVFGKRNGV